MFSNRFLRWLVGGLLGSFAGLSLALSVLPLALQFTGAGDRLEITLRLGRAAPLAATAWALAGLAIARIGRPAPGALILGAAGLVSGALVTAVGYGSAPPLLLAGGLAGLVYGLGGGLLLGRILAPPAAGAE